jgi:hypothetical protein
VSKTLTAIKSIAGVVQELTHNNTATGRISLPPMVPGGKAADYKPMYDLDRIFIHMMATEVCRQAFEIGMAHGIDFKQIGPDGRPKPSAPGGSPPGSEPGKKASQLDKKASEPAVRRVNWDEETVKALTSSLSGLQDLAQSALKAKMKSSLEEKIKAEELPPGHFFWDAKNRSGRRKMTELDEAMGNLSGAWGRLQISVIVEYLENGAALGGMPQEVSYFGLVADPELLAPHWVIGGAIDWKTKNDLEIEATHTTQPHMYKPEGCYQVHTLWKWDESTSVMDCAVTPASLSFTLLADLKLSGDEPDDGWF